MKKLSLLLVSALLIGGLSAHADNTSEDPYIAPLGTADHTQSEAAVNATGCISCGAKSTGGPMLQNNSYSSALPDGYTAPAANTPSGAEGTK